MPRLAVRHILVPMMLIVVALAGCGQGASDGSLQGGDQGARLVATKCSRCHTLDRVERANKDRAGWERTVGRMVQNGLVATAEERETIIAYLTERDASR